MEYNLEIIQKNISSIEFIQKVLVPIELNRANVIFTTGTGEDSSFIWGNIEGNITDQIDLKDQLDLKANKADTYNKSEVNLLIPDISNLASKNEIPVLDGYALRSEIPDITNLATKEEIPSLTNYALKSDIPDITGLATKEEIPVLDNYALKNEIPDISGLSTKSETNTALGGKADLVDGKIPAAQLPSYVDDVLEATSVASFPLIGESGKIYVDTTTNITYRWTGSIYTEISKSLALGETSSSAYRGDRGKTAYDHSQIVTGNPHNTKASDIVNIPSGNLASNTVQSAINELDTIKENSIIAGNITQYLRGDKSWQTLDKSVIGLSNVENTALSAWVGTSKITTLGIISSGTWSATTIAINKGGTGLTALGTANQLLRVNSGATGLEYFTPTWTNNTGTVTSVSITVPTGLTVTGSPITTSGTLALSFSSGYSIPTNTKQTNWDTAYSWGSHSGLYKLVSYVPDWSEITNKPTTLSGYGITDAQPIDADLTAIGSLSGTSGILTKTAANTWTLDTSTYLKANQTITLSGAITGTGSTAIVTTYAGTVPTNKGGTGLTAIGTAGQYLAVNSAATGLEWTSSRDKGVNTVTTLTSLPITKRLITASITSNTTISLASNLDVGDELHIIVYNNSASSITQTLSNSGNFISLSGDSIAIPSGIRIEINILCYANNSYLIRAL